MTSRTFRRPDFFTVQQKDDAFIQEWKKLTKEEVDLETFLKEDEITYYDNPNKTISRFEYDILFHFDLDYDPKIKHCNRPNLKVIRENIFNEEMRRIVPVVVNHNYGHRKTNLEGNPFISHKRIKVIDGIMRRNHVNLKPMKKVPRVHGYPQLI